MIIYEEEVHDMINGDRIRITAQCTLCSIRKTGFVGENVKLVCMRGLSPMPVDSNPICVDAITIPLG